MTLEVRELGAFELPAQIQSPLETDVRDAAIP